MFKLFLKGYWLKETEERQRSEAPFVIMTLSNSQRAALRAKKAIANGETSFRPRGEKNKAAFAALKEQAQPNISASNSISAESPPHTKLKITGKASSHTSVPASLLDLNPKNISDTSDEEDDAMLAKIKTHKEQIKTKEEHMKNELSKQEVSSGPWAMSLPPKTKAQLLMENEEDLKRERSKRSMQIFKIAHEAKQFHVYHYKYKQFEKQEQLLEWLQDVLTQKEAGFDIEDDDTREALWLQEKEDRMQKELHTIMVDYKAKKLFFECNQFLS